MIDGRVQIFAALCAFALTALARAPQATATVDVRLVCYVPVEDVQTDQVCLVPTMFTAMIGIESYSLAGCVVQPYMSWNEGSSESEAAFEDINLLSDAAARGIHARVDDAADHVQIDVDAAAAAPTDVRVATLLLIALVHTLTEAEPGRSVHVSLTLPDDSPQPAGVPAELGPLELGADWDRLLSDALGADCPTFRVPASAPL